MASRDNATLVQEYLDIAIHGSENLARFSGLLSDDCIWYITPPGMTFQGKAEVIAFAGMAMGSRTHDAKYRIEIRNWFADGENFCVEYAQGALITPFHLKVTETVCLVCHMQNGYFDRIHEYVDASASLLIRLALTFLPLIVRASSRPSGTGHR